MSIDVYKPVTTIGVRLRSLRIKKRKSLQDVASATKVSCAFISDIERGKSFPSLQTCQKLANYYDVSLSEMFDDVDIQVKPLAAKRARADRDALRDVLVEVIEHVSHDDGCPGDGNCNCDYGDWQNKARAALEATR